MKMWINFRLSTFLYFVAVVSLVGMLVWERSRCRSMVKSDRLAAMRSGQINKTLSLCRTATNRPDEVQELCEAELIFVVHLVFHHRRDLARIGDSPTELLRKAFHGLNCGSYDEFSQFAKNASSLQGNDDVFPEFFDTDSEANRQFVDFVTKSFDWEKQGSTVNVKSYKGTEQQRVRGTTEDRTDGGRQTGTGPFK